MSKEDIKNESNQVYELGFHLVPSLSDEEAGKAFEEIIKLVEKVGSKIISKSEPALLNLEYQMEKVVDSIKGKYNTAYFAWIIFEGGDVIKLDENLKHSKKVLRHLLIKTDQKDSISTSEIATLLDNQNGPRKTEIVPEEIEDEILEENLEETDKIEDEIVEEKMDQSKVDEAIDELIK